MLDGGADIKVVQELLGHSSPTTTQIYTHISKEKMREIYYSSHPRSKRNWTNIFLLINQINYLRGKNEKNTINKRTKFK